MNSPTPSTLPRLLQSRALGSPEGAYHFYAEEASQSATLTYAELGAQVEALAACLRRYDVGERVIIAVPPGPGFLRAFFASLHAGLVPVPVPVLGARSQSRNRALDIIVDADPVAVFLPLGKHAGEPQLSHLDLYDPDQPAAAAHADGFRDVSPDAPALLQYSSGTGGRPKGVVLTHRAVLSNLEQIQKAFGHSTASRGLSWLPPFHDMGLVGGLLQPLYVGFPVCIMRPETFARQPLRWLQAISAFRATTSGGPTAAYEACLRSYRADERSELVASLDLSTWRVPFVGAEPVHADTLSRFAKVFAPHGFRADGFVPCYGLAENTLMVTAHRHGAPLAHETAERGEPVVSCGWAVPPTEIIIVDPHRQEEVPDGARGEVWVAGPSVAAGYFNRIEETAQTFGAHCSSRPGKQFLRTGDLGFVKQQQLFITGRLKNLLIVNGQNYEPELLEQVLLARCGLDSILSLVVFGPEDGRGPIVVLVEVDHRQPHEAHAAIEPRLRRVLAEEFQLSIGPVKLVKRGTLARTSSGKLQRREIEAAYRENSLAFLNVEQSAGREGVEASDEVPGTAIGSSLESRLLDLLARALHTSPQRCREARSLAALGIDSLKAMSLQEQIATELGVELSVLDLLTASSVSELAATGRRRADVAASEVDFSPTVVQRSIWFAHQLDPGVGAFNLCCVVHVQQDLSLELLADAVRHVVLAEPELRAAYHVRGRVLSKQPVDAFEPAVERVVSEEAFRRRPFDLEVPPLLRVGVASPEERPGLGQRPGFRLFVLVHHIAADYASVATVVERLCETYQALILGQAAEARRPPRASVARPAPAARPGHPPNLDYTRLVTDRPRGSWAWNVATRQRNIDEPLNASLDEVAAGLGLTRHALMLGALMALLARYTGEQTITVGSPLSLRPIEKDRSVGCFTSLVPVSVELERDATLADVAEAIMRQTARAIDATLGTSALPDAPSGNPTGVQLPICSVAFAMYPDLSPSRGPSAWRVDGSHDNAALFELFFRVSRLRGQTTLELAYAQDLFDAETADGLLAHFSTLLAEGLRSPRTALRNLGVGRADVPLSSPTPSSEPYCSVAARCRQQMATTPHRTAIVCGTHHSSYGGLQHESQRLAGRLQRLGIGRETLVGIHLPRDVHLVAAMLAVLDVGAAYVPLDPNLPPNRLTWMVDDANVEFVLTNSSQQEIFQGTRARLVCVDQDAGSSSGPFRRQDIHPEQLAYVLYTSGSTGTPKAVGIRHAGVSHLMDWAARFFSPEREERVLASTSLGFDLSVFEILAPLCHGATVVLTGSIADLPTIESRQSLTLINTVPSALAALLPWLPRSVHTVNLAGEALGLALTRDLFEARHVKRVMNLYGPSEDTTYSTAHSMSASDEAVSIGRSLPGKGALVCDDQVSPLPIGVPGELCLFGPGLARGYVNARSSTALRFVPHPLSPVPGARLYRTGDRVRLSARGELRFDGRIDRQLKLRGFRIEPSEIEHVIGRDPGVVTSAVIVDDRLPAHPSLVAFVVPTSTEGEAQGILGRARARALESLPPYMVPQRFVLVEKLHVTANGKLDRVALLAQLGAEAPVAPVAPRSELERELLGSWQTWLSTTQLGVFDSLFAHGADSLLLLRFVAEVRERYGVELSIKDAFRYPSVAAVCELIEDRRRHPTDRDDALLRSVERLSDEEAHRMLEAMERDAK